MIDLTFALSQQIGVYYKTKEWAYQVFDKIVNHYPLEWFEERGIRKSKDPSNCCLLFKDGSSIRFRPAIESSRGSCFSKIIIEPDIDEEIVNCVIRPTLKHMNREVMIFSDEAGVDRWWR